MPEFLSKIITAQFLVSVVLNAIIVHVILISVAYLVMAERKISAWMQDRIGPNRVGFDFGLPALTFLKGMWGLGQPLADGIKFFLKEDYAPRRVDFILFTLAPGIVVIPALIGFVVMPWGGVFQCPDIPIPFTNSVIPGGMVHFTGANVNIGIVYLLAVASLGVYGVTLGGWASNNKYSFLGSLRATAQMLSYEIPLGLALLCVLLIAGTVIPEEIVRQQVHGGWNILAQPVAAVIFFLAILAEANRAPFDNAECEQELVGGYHTEYSSMRFALYFLAEYSHLVTSSAFFVLLFMGGYHLPFVKWLNPAETTFLAAVIKFLVFFGKVLFIACFTMVIRWTIPRLRYDQVMTQAWGAVIPLSLLAVVMTSVMVYFDARGLVPMLGANAVVIVLMFVLNPLLPKHQPNRRVPLYGSRFNPMPGERVLTRPTDPTALEDRPVEGMVAGATASNR